MSARQATFSRIESAFFKTLNTIARPAIKAGLGSPGPLPTGLIVLETIGRKTGRVFETPVVASKFGRYLLVGTVRGNSQWIKNLAVQTEVDYWIKGNTRSALATVFLPNDDLAEKRAELPRLLWPLASVLFQFTRRLGASFVILQTDA
jgi:deazaflavin-dependent oxidoreductase (nitroreductase family)